MEREQREGLEEKLDATTVWLLSFEKLAATPVVISLLIENGAFSFISMQAKDIWELSFGRPEEESDDERKPIKLPAVDSLKGKAPLVDYFG